MVHSVYQFIIVVVYIPRSSPMIDCIIDQIFVRITYNRWLFRWKFTVDEFDLWFLEGFVDLLNWCEWDVHLLENCFNHCLFALDRGYLRMDVLQLFLLGNRSSPESNSHLCYLNVDCNFHPSCNSTCATNVTSLGSTVFDTIRSWGALDLMVIFSEPVKSH